MARVLSTEKSLSDRREAIRTEARWLKRLMPYEAAAAVACLVAAAVAWVGGGRPMPWLVASSIAAVLAIGHGWKRRQDESEHRILGAGRSGERRVAEQLAVLDDRHAVFNDVTLRSGLRRAQIDHLVIGPHGVVVMETKNWSGTLVGSADDSVWRQMRPGQPPRRLDNPLRQNEQHAAVVRDLLRRAGVGEVPVESLVVMASPEVRLELESSAKRQVLTAENLHAWWTARIATPPVIGPDEVERIIAWIRQGAA